MVACLRGDFVWREFKGVNREVKSLLTGMAICYLLALVLIARAYAG